MNEFDRERLDRLDKAIRTLNREMGQVQGALEQIDKRVNDIRWLMGAVGLPVIIAAIKVIVG